MGQGEKWARAMFTGAGLALALFAMLHGSGALAQPAYTGETLTAFARAAQAVSALRDSYMPRITAANIAERPERAEALFDEMRARMHDAIDGVGLSVEDYEAISDSAARDAALRARIEGILAGKPPAAAPAPKPGLGVRAPARSPDMAAAQREVDAAAAALRIAELERKLAEAEARSERAERARRAAKKEAERLKADHAALTRDYNFELNTRPSPEALAEMADALEAVRSEREELQRALGKLGQELGTVIAALTALDGALAVSDAETNRRAVRRFTRLEPAPVALPASPGAGVTGFVAATGTLQAQLDAAEARNLALRATRD
ncbi:MAG: DUF4168 domain-containing protein, partial [Alphaproteobacteria bacterium]|nr:DUF4168 domain-containing protein [Alphaproteobacteria bacterium]